MGRGLAVALTALAGVLVAFQAPLNSRLGKSVGTFPAAVVSFGVGLVILVVVALASGGFGRLPEARHLRWYLFLGGALGAVYVAVSLVTVRTLGASGVIAAIIAGQLSASVLIDRFGLVGVSRHPVGVLRIVGIVLLALGTFLVVRE